MLSSTGLQAEHRGTDHHLLQQVKNIEVTGKDLQPYKHMHTHTFEDITPKLLATLSCSQSFRCRRKVCARRGLVNVTLFFKF